MRVSNLDFPIYQEANGLFKESTCTAQLMSQKWL
jgi:hypothetical protein